MKREFEKTVADARRDLVPEEPDWAAMDEKLFARIEAHEAQEKASRVAQLTDRPRVWGVVAGGLAAAAAIALLAKHPSGGPPLAAEDRAADIVAAKASALVVRKGAGEVTASHAPSGVSTLETGADLRVGDVVETKNATAYFQRASSTPGGKPAVTWTVEDQSRIAVSKATGALVLALERGAVEAQVTPVPSGEAFAVDIAATDGKVTRVAVHGTHLRVARVERAGKAKVVVDLSEGVISVGAPPRAGSTYGTLVTAPAHVELDPADPGALTVSHEAVDVRTPLDLGVELGAPMVAPRSVTVPPLANVLPSASAQPAAKPVSTSQAGASHAAPAPVADADAEQATIAAVKACMASHATPPDAQVTVTVSSVLQLTLNEAGGVDLARFEPPLPPDVQSCAANAIYKTRFPKDGKGGGGTVQIRLNF